MISVFMAFKNGNLSTVSSSHTITVFFEFIKEDDKYSKFFGKTILLRLVPAKASLFISFREDGSVSVSSLNVTRSKAFSSIISNVSGRVIFVISALRKLCEASFFVFFNLIFLIVAFTKAFFGTSFVF